MPRFRSAYDGRAKEISDKSAIYFAGIDADGVPEEGYDGRTTQANAKECDINYIFDKYRVTGTVRVPLSRANPQYTFVPSNTDLQSAMNLTLKSQRDFNALPSDLRKRFGNDYTKLYAFLNDPSKMEESYALGLRKKPTDASGAESADATGARAGASKAPRSEAQPVSGAEGAKA